MTPPDELVVRTLQVDDRPVKVTAPNSSEWERGPGDIIRVIVAVAAALAAFVAFDFAKNTAIGFEEDIATAIHAIPRFFIISIYGVIVVLAGLVGPCVVVWLIVKRNWRLLGLYVITTAITTGTFLLLQEWIEERAPEPAQSVHNLPDWFTDLQPAWIAALAAALVVSTPWMSRRWRRVAWLLLALIVPMRFLLGVDVPTGLLFALAGGWLIGSLVVLAAGAPQRNPSADDVVRGLDEAGVQLTSMKRAGVDARGSTPYFGVDIEGNGLFIKVLGADERDADLLFRVYRWFRLSGIGDERPFSSLRRTVEHEALVSMTAQRSGLVTPPVRAVVELPDRSMALVYERIDGHSLDEVPDAQITPELLAGVWGEVQELRTARIAHRDLRLANVFDTADGRPMLIDFGFGEISASTTLLDQDVCELLCSTATVVGAQQAVSLAVGALGSEAVARATPRIQPLALSGATQSAMKHNKGLLDEVREQVVSQTGVEAPPLAKLQRIKPRTLVMTALLFFAVWFLIPQFTELPRIMVQIRDADWKWAIPALVFSMLTYLGAALSLSSSVSPRLSVRATTWVTLAGSFVNRVAPAKIGAVALNLRYLQKQGFETAVAGASIGLYQLVGTLTHLTLLLVFGIIAQNSVSITEFLPKGTILLIVAAVILTAIGVVVGVPKLRRMFKAVVRPQMTKVLASLKDLLRHPVRLLVMVVGSAILTLSYIGALWASIQAFGGGVPLAGIAVVFLGGASLAAAAPTPGGIGAVEAALIAGLAAIGLPTAVAVPAVFLYRLATFWVPILPGWLGFRVLQQRSEI